MAATPGARAGLAPSRPKALITSFHMARVCFYPKPSGTPSHRSVEDLELLVQIRRFTDHRRLNLVRFFVHFGSATQRLLLGGLDSDVIIMDRSADSLAPLRSIGTSSLAPCASQSPPRSLQARIPSFEQRHGCRTNCFSAAHTADAWSSSVPFGKLEVDSVFRLRIEIRSSHVNHQEDCPLLVA